MFCCYGHVCSVAQANNLLLTDSTVDIELAVLGLLTGAQAVECFAERIMKCLPDTRTVMKPDPLLHKHLHP